MKKELTEVLDKELTPFMADLGFSFRKSKRTFSRTYGEAIQAINADVLAYPNKTYRISSHCKLGFPKLESVCLTHHAYGKEQKPFYFFCLNCDNLYNSDVSSNLSISEEDRESAVHNLRIGIERDIIPFLNRYADVDTLVQNLDESDWKKWATSDPLARAAIRLTYHALSNSREKFDTAAKDLRKFCDTPQGAVHAPFADELITGLEINQLKSAQQSAGDYGGQAAAPQP